MTQKYQQPTQSAAKGNYKKKETKNMKTIKNSNSNTGKKNNKPEASKMHFLKGQDHLINNCFELSEK